MERMEEYFKNLPPNAYPIFGGGGDDCDLSGVDKKIDKILEELDALKKEKGIDTECKDCKSKDDLILKYKEKIKLLTETLRKELEK